MGVLLGLAPFIVFAALDRVAGPPAGLVAGMLVALALIVRELIGRRAPKVLEIGTVVVFAVLAAVVIPSGATWPAAAVRLAVDSGLLLIILVSMLIRRPFTLQYARERVPESLWYDPHFIRTNYVISAAWAAAFAVIIGADLLLLSDSVPRGTAVAIIVVALIGAVRFTDWYPEQARRRALGAAS